MHEQGRHGVLAIYTGLQGDDRNADFMQGKMQFEHVFLRGSTMARCRQLMALLRRCRYDHLVLGGWDSVESWLAAFISPRKKNDLVAESSVWESVTHGLKGRIKHRFVARIGGTAYVPGVSNGKLVRALGFKGRMVYTRGVGVFNYIAQPPYVAREQVTKFLYVGRLVEVKNLKILISVFNDLPQLSLTIAGFGEQEAELKAMAKSNVTFLGAVNNKQLPEVYQAHDVFILPSKSETWGIVVEEALNNGLPVIVSDRVGCHEALVNEENGLVFPLSEGQEALRRAVLKMTDVTYYNHLREHISHYDFAAIEREQVESYL